MFKRLAMAVGIPAAAQITAQLLFVQNTAGVWTWVPTAGR
jgi:hypothetical protein